MRSFSKSLAFWLSLLLFWSVLIWAVWQLLNNPSAGLPRQWNPIAPLHISDPITPFTALKLRRISADPQSCLATLETGPVSYQEMDPLVQSEQCGISNRVSLRGVGSASMAPVETQCAIALRLAMWERHSLAPAARELMGSELSAINHLSSYNCRQIRTPGGGSGRMSTHATGEAIDIAGFQFQDGQRIRLVSDWKGAGPKAAFLRAARDGACTWFATTLGPEFNALHADHFHLQSRGWGTCQ